MTLLPITDMQLAQSVGCALIVADAWLPWINDGMIEFEINTQARVAPYLANVAHESGSLRWVKEIWGPTAAQLRYEGRVDLGNTQPGDGMRFMGHGLIQITGRANHAACRDGLRARGIDCPDFEVEPEKLMLPRWAAMSAAWFWWAHGLNELADAGDFEAIVRRINGGLNGYEERVAFLEHANEVLA